MRRYDFVFLSLFFILALTFGALKCKAHISKAMFCHPTSVIKVLDSNTLLVTMSLDLGVYYAAHVDIVNYKPLKGKDGRLAKKWLTNHLRRQGNAILVCPVKKSKRGYWISEVYNMDGSFNISHELNKRFPPKKPAL